MASWIARRAPGAAKNAEHDVVNAEAGLIGRFFSSLGAVRADVVLGVGDDAALLQVPPGQQLVLTTDALVEGVHFLPGADPRALGHRALVVNLSDLAAMGATPAWALLSLNLPQADPHWLAQFTAGFDGLARQHGMALVGGNLSGGPLSITVLAAGLVEPGTALHRGTARAGDLLCVSGAVGDAAAGLALLQQRLTASQAAPLIARFETPTPRVALGRALRSIASACIDVSDGLWADAARLAAASGLGARLELQRLPISAALAAAAGADAWRYALGGGEDYELLFALPPQAQEQLSALTAVAQCPLTVIGELQAEPGLRLQGPDGVMQFSHSGFDHFAN